MSNKLTPQVPRWLLRLLADSPSAAAPGRMYRFEAAILVLDIVGFTALTEKLASTGPRGVEMLERILETVFRTLVGTVLAFGGDVTQFGGDAITCLWPAGENKDGRQALRRASSAALNVQALMRRFNRVDTPTGPERLEVRLGIGYGPATAFILGNETQRLWTVAGPALDRAIRAELAARPNQVRLCPEALEMLAPIASTDGDGHLLALNALVRPAPMLPPLVDDALVQPFLHPVLVSRSFSPSQEFAGEFRPVVPLFMHCEPPSGTEGTEEAAVLLRHGFGDWLNGWVQAVQENVNRFGGWLSTVEVGDKGNVLVVHFGTPTAHEDDEARAVGCALALRDTAATLFPGMKLHIGITKGWLFDGPIGAPERYAFAHVGDEMNLAARLMMLARPGQVLISGWVRSAIGDEFVCRDMGPVRVRGKEQAVPVFDVQMVRRRDGLQTFRRVGFGRELIGREAELELAATVMAQARQRHSQVLIVDGETGIGKSHLAAELVARWLRQDGVVFNGDCHLFSRETPYMPWRRIIGAAAQLLTGNGGDEITPEATLESVRRVLRELPLLHSGQDPDYWVRRLPLLAEVLGWEVDDNDLTRPLIGEARQDNTFAVVQMLLYSIAEKVPVLLFIEDAHRADDLSLQLALSVADNLRSSPILLLLTRRTLMVPISETWEALERLPNCTLLTLGELTEKDSRRLIQSTLGGGEVPETLATIVFERAQGNPFFTEEMVRMFRDVGCLVLEEGEEEVRVVFDPLMASLTAVPDTVQGVVQARVDELEEEDRLTLKVASVIGRQIPYRVLEGIYPVPIEERKLRSHLRTAEYLGLMVLEQLSPEPEYVFKHGITQEVVYQGLTFAQRRRLHTAVARWYEERYAGNLEPYYPLLAYHYGRAGREEAELHYLLLAADRAAHVHAISDAVRYYERALELLDRESEPARTAHVLTRLAHGLHYTGRYESAQRYFRQALALYEQLDDPVHAAEACFEVANRLEVQDLEQALEYTLRGLDYVRDRPDARHQFIVGSAYLAHLYRGLGRHREANELLLHSLKMAKEHEDLYGLWKCYRSLSIYHYIRGELREAFEYGRQTIRYAQLCDAPVQHRVIALNNQACFAQELGALDEAIEVGEKGMALARRAGVISEQVILASTLAGIYNHIGDWERAEGILQEGFRLLERHYHIYHDVALRIEAGKTAGGQGDWRRAIELWEDAERKSHTGSARSFTAELQAYLAEGWMRLGDLEQARRWLDSAESLAGELEQRGVLVSVYRARGLLEWAQGELHAGEVALQEALALARSLDDPVKTAQVLFEYGRLLVEAGRLNEGVARLREAEGYARRVNLLPVVRAARQDLFSLNTLPL